jgi:hypothetical protein
MEFDTASLIHIQKKNMVIEIRSAALFLRFIELVQKLAGIFLSC